jgi:cell wall-associated NlpC family hydrolase/peptidoglycan hydrolase CwlO-like protein
MPRRVNPVILLGIIIVAVLSFGLSAGAAPEDGAVPESVLEKSVAPNEVTAPVVVPSGEGGAPPEVPAPESTTIIAPGEGEAPEGSAPVGDAVPEDDIAPNKGAAASEEQEDALEEITTSEESPVQEDAESDVAKGAIPEKEAEIGEVAEGAGNEFQRMLTEAEAADGEYNNALLEENQLSIEIAETSNDRATAEDSLEEAQGNLEDRASQMYVNGQDGFLGMLLGARDVSDFKDLLGLWVQLLDQDQKEVQEWRGSRDQLEQNTQDLEAQLEEWEETREEASTKKEEAETRVEQAQEFFEAQEQEVQEKIEEDRAREAELALDHVGKMLQDATGEQPPELAAGEEENSDESETGANETTGDEQAIQLAGEDKSEEIEQARQAGAEAPDRTPEEEQDRQGEVAQALAETIQEWQAQKKPLAEAIEEPVKEREAGAAPDGGPSGSPAQNPAAEQMAAAAEEQAKAQEQSTKAAEQAAAEKEARENAATRAEEAEKAKLAVELLPAAEQNAALNAAQEAERNAALAAEKAGEQKLAAEEAAGQAIEKQSAAAELGESAAQKAAENGIPQPKLGTSGGGVLDYAQDWLGVPYDYSHSAGQSRAGVDCSAFTAAVYKKFGITLPDSPAGQLGMGAPVSGPAKAGDLVFFSEDGSGVPTHVGISNGDGTLTHASNFTGEVSVTDMDYLTGYMGARRLM